MKTNVTVQVNGNDTLINDLEKAVKEELKIAGVKVSTITNLELYFKPLEKECYYVASFKAGKEITGKICC